MLISFFIGILFALALAVVYKFITGAAFLGIEAIGNKIRETSRKRKESKHGVIVTRK